MSPPLLLHAVRAVAIIVGWWGGVAWSDADPTYNPPAGYYAAADGLTGPSLKSALNQIIRNHSVIPYTSPFTDTWDALRALDEDPANSADVVLVYSGASWPKSDTNGDGNSGTSASWEREHCWPRSYSVGDSGADTSDLFNLRACRRSVNASRGNRIYAQADPDDPIDPAIAPPSCPECLYDYHGDQGGIWTPRPGEKGDLARAMFYMAVRYDGRDAGTVDLELGDTPDEDAGIFGHLTTLLAWHLDDPVSETERRRNHLIFADYQGNRNPFIDHPEMVAAVFGTTTTAPLLTIEASPSLLDEGASGTGTVSIPAAAPANVVVTLSKTGDPTGSELTIPPTVTIPAGLTSAGFSVSALTDGVVDGDKAITIKAEASGYEIGLTSVTVVDINVPDPGGSSSTTITAAGYYTQHFDSLLSTGSAEWVDDQTIPGWYAQRSGNGSSITASTGTTSTGGLYSFGTSAADRALGSLGSANAAAGSFAWGVSFQNATASAIDLTTLAFTGEQWRYSGTAAAQAVTFSYRKGTSPAADLTPTNDTGWTAVEDLSFHSPVIAATAGALDGNAAANSSRVTADLGLQLEPGEWITFRWRDVDHSGTDHALAIDDFRLDWELPPSVTPPAITSPLAASGKVEEPFSYTISASNSPTFFEAESLPDGLSIDGATGIISGTPAMQGIYDVGILAGNDGGADVATLVLTIANGGTTFAEWSGGAVLTNELLLAYAVGGAAGPGAAGDGQTVSIGSGELVLTAIVRIDDPLLLVGAEAVTDLASFGNPALVTLVAGSAVGVNQAGVAAGCERREFRFATTADRGFIRLRAELEE